ncbi:hypothetical protein D3C78_1367370 [compost metagenome]
MVWFITICKLNLCASNSTLRPFLIIVDDLRISSNSGLLIALILNFKRLPSSPLKRGDTATSSVRFSTGLLFKKSCKLILFHPPKYIRLLLGACNSIELIFNVIIIESKRKFLIQHVITCRIKTCSNYTVEVTTF